MSGGSLSLVAGLVMVVLTLFSLVLVGASVWMAIEWSWHYIFMVLITLALTVGLAAGAGMMLADWKESW